MNTYKWILLAWLGANMLYAPYRIGRPRAWYTAWDAVGAITELAIAAWLVVNA